MVIPKWNKKWKKERKKKRKPLPQNWYDKGINPVTGWKTSTVNNQKGAGLPTYHIEKPKNK